MRVPGTAAVAVVAATLFGCGYVGEPLPPLLQIPARVTGLAAVQRGARVIVQFTAPQLTTEGTPVRAPLRLELRAGPGQQGPFNAGQWAAAAQLIEARPNKEGVVRVELPAGPWTNKEIFFAVKAIGPTGRDIGWSDFVALTVIPPIEAPGGVRAEATSAGVRVTWTGSAPSYRVFRHDTLAATVDKPEWTDAATEFGKTYRYTVQAIQGNAESEISAVAEITPSDKFPPAVPAGVKSVAASGAIELVWDPNTEADLAGYRIYRAADNAEFTRLTDTQENPSFTDRMVEAGKRYRYSLTSIDRLGNESPRSEPVEVTAAP